MYTNIFMLYGAGFDDHWTSKKWCFYVYLSRFRPFM